MGVQAGPRTDQTPPGNRILERVKARIVRELWRISFTPLTAELPAQTTARASLGERAQSRWSTAERAIPLRHAASDKIENAIRCGSSNGLLSTAQSNAGASYFRAWERELETTFWHLTALTSFAHEHPGNSRDNRLHHLTDLGVIARHGRERTRCAANEHHGIAAFYKCSAAEFDKHFEHLLKSFIQCCIGADIARCHKCPPHAAPHDRDLIRTKALLERR